MWAFVTDVLFAAFVNAIFFEAAYLLNLVPATFAGFFGFWVLGVSVAWLLGMVVGGIERLSWQLKADHLTYMWAMFWPQNWPALRYVFAMTTLCFTFNWLQVAFLLYVAFWYAVFIVWKLIRKII